MLINLSGYLIDFSSPIVMGILNITPDSFFEGSRCQTADKIRYRVEEIVRQGGKIIDAGGYSTRPGAKEVTAEEELDRIILALEIIRENFPEVPVSVDTFRADVARIAVSDFGAAIVNDISGGELDDRMFETVANLKVPYILMHMKGNPQTMQQNTDYVDFIPEIFLYFAEKVNRLKQLGVNDIILDPGFGFAKTLDQNYELLAKMNLFSQFGLPVLAGVSRKRMIWQLLDATPGESLNGTTALNMLALTQGADILRVHDVKEAVEAVKIYEKFKEFNVQDFKNSKV
ncbi:MAG: dihydropteroate synthase [Prevotellaceae bacterium]|jgi:dihydropteroate synthase|nr:dihydropteroate synthase [Prevotellaceae bacterium]